MRILVVVIVLAFLAATAVGAFCFDGTETATARSVVRTDEDLVTIDLDVRVPARGPTLITLADAQDIAAKSSILFQKQRPRPGYVDDVACAVVVKIKGNQLSQYPVDYFGTEPVVVNSQIAFDRLFSDVAGIPAEANHWHVRVVKNIVWCRTFVSAGGCGSLTSRRMVIAKRLPTTDGIFWAHELGHTQGLPHRDDSFLNLMHTIINPEHDHLSDSECAAFRK